MTGALSLLALLLAGWALMTRPSEDTMPSLCSPREWVRRHRERLRRRREYVEAWRAVTRLHHHPEPHPTEVGAPVRTTFPNHGGPHVQCR